MLYEAEIITTDSEGNTARALHSTLAIRRFTVRGRSLYLNSKRWVLRGIYDHGPVADVEAWRRFAPARVTRKDRLDITSQAAVQGLMIVHRVRTFQLAQPPAVAMLLFAKGMQLTDGLKSTAPNLLFAQEIAGAEELSPHADVAWMQVTGLADFAARAADISIPIIAERRYGGTSLAEARAAIDQLQADLAPLGQFAGYVV
jgi:hypothetical protein